MDRRAGLRIVMAMRGWRADLTPAAVALVSAAFIALLDPPAAEILVLSIAVTCAVRRFPPLVLAGQAALVVAGGGTTPFAIIVTVLLMLVALAVVALRYGPRTVAVWWALAYAAMLLGLSREHPQDRVSPDRPRQGEPRRA